MSTAAPLPLTAADLKRAAEDLFADHGDSALGKAEERVRTLRSEGFESMARTWELFQEAAAQMQQTQRLDSYRAALSTGVSLSEYVSSPLLDDLAQGRISGLFPGMPISAPEGET